MREKGLFKGGALKDLFFGFSGVHRVWREVRSDC